MIGAVLRRAGVVAPYDAAVTLDFINHIISAMRIARWCPAFPWGKVAERSEVG